MDDLTKQRIKQDEASLATGVSRMADALDGMTLGNFGQELLRIGCPPEAQPFLGYPFGMCACAVGTLLLAGISVENIDGVWDALLNEKDVQISSCNCARLECPSHPRKMQQAIRALYDTLDETILILAESLAPANIDTQPKEFQEAIVHDARGRAVSLLKFYSSVVIKAGIDRIVS